MDANRNFEAAPSDPVAATTIGIAEGKVMRIEKGLGRRLRVESGSVWLTQHQCTDDVIVEAGGSYLIERDGLALLTNFGRQLALVTLEPAVGGEQPRKERLWKFWAGLYAPQSRPTTAGL